MNTTLDIIYSDNHLIALNKLPGQISQSDKTGDASLFDLLKEHIRVTYQKPGNVYLALLHRIDRPVSGVLLFARTGKAADRMSEMIRERQFQKTYWAVVKNRPPKDADTLEHYLVKNEKQNKSYVSTANNKDAKPARSSYRLLQTLHRYYLLEVSLHTGRHHQIRAQLAAMGCPIKGDIKYGFDRTNSDGSIHLHARSLQFTHPVTKEEIRLFADPPKDPIWDACLPDA